MYIQTLVPCYGAGCRNNGKSGRNGSPLCLNVRRKLLYCDEPIKKRTLKTIACPTYVGRVCLIAKEV